MPTLKCEMIQEICEDMGRKEDFSAYLRYVGDAKGRAADWFAEKLSDVLFTEKKFTETVEELVNFRIDILVKAVKKCTRPSKTEVCLSGKWLKELSSLLPDTFIDFSSFELLDNHVKLYDMDNFLECLLQQNFKRDQLKKDCMSNIFEMEISILSHANEKLFEYLWGCNETCPFCNEPCVKQSKHDDSNHICKQHRPNCCKGVRDRFTGEAKLHVCNYKVRSDVSYSCAVINKKCKCSSETFHSYRDYKEINPQWDITPSSNMYDTTKFWMRFIGIYKKDLASHYGYSVRNVPYAWEKISLSEAIESLKNYT